MFKGASGGRQDASDISGGFDGSSGILGKFISLNVSFSGISGSFKGVIRRFKEYQETFYSVSERFLVV